MSLWRFLLPIYEYECRSCSKRIEVLQKMSDPPLTSCDACNGSLHRIVSPSGLIFKGSGFYINDYARKNKEGDSETKGKKKTAPASGDKQKKETPAKPKPKK